MKRILLAALHVLMAAALAGCASRDIETPDNRSDIVIAGADRTLEFPVDGGMRQVAMIASDDWTATLVDTGDGGWCRLSPASGAAGAATLTFEVDPNRPDNGTRTATARIRCASTSLTIIVTQASEIADREREVLEEFYRSTGGDDWTSRTGWCSDTPLENWYGVTVDRTSGRVTAITLRENNLAGTLPESLGELTALESLVVRSNGLTGRIPESLRALDVWRTDWINILFGNDFDLADTEIPAPQFSLADLDGAQVDSREVYARNRLTMLFVWTPYFGDVITSYARYVIPLWMDYMDDGFEVVSLASSYGTTPDEVRTFAAANLPEWTTCYLSDADGRSSLGTSIVFFPTIIIIDSEGRVVYNNASDDFLDMEPFVRSTLGTAGNDGYESTDYSRNGEIRQLQRATRGNGIDIVLMGDAFTDRMIDEGEYDRVMNAAAEALFSEEPYATFRDMFNVYAVTAVSPNGYYGDGSRTVFECTFGDGTLVGGNDGKAMLYALEAVGDERMDEALIVVMMNSRRYAGTCYMYHPSARGDFGSGTAVSYFPTGTDDEALAQVLHHEANGHGFAKLGDEYAYEERGEITASARTSFVNLADNYGWYKNLDLTGDPSQVKWSRFLGDSRYAAEGLGVFEGGYTYWRGVYRPTDNSIMNDNTGGFNAPSREAIYYRMHRLAYGSAWQYDYEEFVRYDAVNRTATRTPSGMFVGTASGVSGDTEVGEMFVYGTESTLRRFSSRGGASSSPRMPLSPPVIVDKTWRESIGTN